MKISQQLFKKNYNQIYITFFILMMASLLIGQTQIGEGIEGEAGGDQLGRSVSMSADGNRVAIGAFGNDENGNRSGYVRVFELSPDSSWVQLGENILGVIAEEWSGYSVSMSSSGDIVAIGAPRNNDGGDQAGKVRVYGYSNGGWAQIGSDITGNAEDQSGHSVSISGTGDRLIIGAPRGVSGLSRVYEYSGGEWVQLGSDILGENEDDDAGTSVAISSDGLRVIIGAILNNGNGSNSGHARIYEYSGGEWVQLGSDINGEAADDYFGRSVALSGDGNVAIIGGDNNDGNGGKSGHARVYTFTGSEWVQIGSDIDGEAEGDESGFKVSISTDGNIVGIGSPKRNTNGTRSGQARVFELSGGEWSQIGDVYGVETNDEAGFSLALSGNGVMIAVGSPFNSALGLGTGHVRIYQLMDSSSSVHSAVDSESNFLIHPNPNNGQFTLSFENPNKQDAFLQVFGMDGALILSKTMDSFQNDILNLPQGKTYVVVLHVGEEIISKRVVTMESR